MNPAAATYVRLAEYQAKGAVLLIAVDEEGLLLLDRPRVLNQLESAAQKCGFSAVRLQAKGAPAEAAGRRRTAWRKFFAPLGSWAWT